MNLVHEDLDLVDPSDPQQLRAAVGERVWFHSIDLGNGIVTAGQKRPAALQAELAALKLPELRGKSVLDIGAYDGFYSFEAERRGAARVVALDHHAWKVETVLSETALAQASDAGRLPDPPFPTDMLRWIDGGSQMPGKKKFELCRRALGSHVEAVVADLMAVDAARLGTFDVVLFMGVLYHLQDPLGGMRKLAALTKEVAVIETEAIALDGLECRSLCEFFPFNELNGDYSNWWAPNERALVDLCRAAGFKRVDIIQGPPTRGDAASDPKTAVRYRLIAHAHKS